MRIGVTSRFSGGAAIVAVSIMLASCVAPDAAALQAQKVITPVAGRPCPKLGLTVEHDLRLYTCVRPKRTLVWNGGVAVFAPVPKARNALDYSKVDVSNLDEYGFDVIHKLWQEKARLSAAATPQVQSEILISPNSQLGGLKPAEILKRADQFFAWIDLPYRYTVFYLHDSDIGWANTQYRARYGTGINLGSLCRQRCNGGNAMRVDSNWLHMNVGAQTTRDGAPVGFMELHEYTHVVQQALSVSNENFSKAPGWLVEGNANFFAQLATVRSIEEYAKNRAAYKGTSRSQPVPSEQMLLEYLNREVNRDPKDGNAYNWGFYFSEAMSVLFGLKATIDLYRNLAVADSYEQAIEMTFAMSWTDLKPRVARTANFLMQPSLRG